MFIKIFIVFFDIKKDHWLDWAKDCGKFAEQTVDDLKFVFPVAVMFLPLPFFWALFDMQGRL